MCPLLQSARKRAPVVGRFAALLLIAWRSCFRVVLMKYRMSNATIFLACLAIASYALSWTGAAIGFDVLGMLFETLATLSSMGTMV
jgi:hypothetical protein